MKIVEVRWDDSYTTNGGWENEGDAFSVEPSHISSVGYLLCGNKEKVVLLQSQTEGSDLVMGVLAIPKKCITSLRYIEGVK